MPPYNPIPHSQGTSVSSSFGHHSAQSGGESDESARMKQKQNKAHLDNRLRIAKLEIGERERRMQTLERDMQALEREVEHARQDEKRSGDELKAMEHVATKEEGGSKSAALSMRDKDMEIKRRSDEALKLEREISQLRIQIEEKERKQAEIKEETRIFTRDKEELRRKYELGHFSAQSQEGHAHDKSQQVARFRLEAERKEAELQHKKHEKETLKHELLIKSQDVSQIESELRHMGQM